MERRLPLHFRLPAQAARGEVTLSVDTLQIYRAQIVLSIGTAMREIGIIELNLAVENQHGSHSHACPIGAGQGGIRRRGGWDDVVHVFQSLRPPQGSKAYASSSPIEGSDKRRFFAVLHLPPVTSPTEAVRAAIVAEHRSHR